MEAAHEVVEAMASSWDQAGHYAPRGWRVVCSCGWSERGLADQVAASDAWRAHGGIS